MNTKSTRIHPTQVNVKWNGYPTSGMRPYVEVFYNILMNN